MAENKVDKIENLLIQIQGKLNTVEQKTNDTGLKMDRVIEDNAELMFAVYGGKGLKKSSILSRVDYLELELNKIKTWVGSIKVSWAIIGGIAGVVSPIVYILVTKFIDKIF